MIMSSNWLFDTKKQLQAAAPRQGLISGQLQR